MRQKNRPSGQVSQSIAVSAALMLALFLLPLAVVAPFRSALFGREDPADETGPEAESPPPPPVSGGQDASRTLRVLDGVEVLNGSTTLEANRTALEYAQKYGIQPLGASDAHCLSQLGKYVTWMPEEPKDLESFIRTLRSGTCRPAIWEDGAFRVVDTF